MLFGVVLQRALAFRAASRGHQPVRRMTAAHNLSPVRATHCVTESPTPHDFAGTWSSEMVEGHCPACSARAECQNGMQSSAIKSPTACRQGQGTCVKARPFEKQHGVKVDQDWQGHLQAGAGVIPLHLPSSTTSSREVWDGE